MNWAAVTAIGTVLAGLALPLAFIQLGALRQDRLRAQVSKIGAWTGPPETPHDKPIGFERAIPVIIRNSSKLPATIDSAELSIWDRLSVPTGANTPT